jgi:hypothetical protein
VNPATPDEHRDEQAHPERACRNQQASLILRIGMNHGMVDAGVARHGLYL